MDKNTLQAQRLRAEAEAKEQARQAETVSATDPGESPENPPDPENNAYEDRSGSTISDEVVSQQGGIDAEPPEEFGKLDKILEQLMELDVLHATLEGVRYSVCGAENATNIDRTVVRIGQAVGLMADQVCTLMERISKVITKCEVMYAAFNNQTLAISATRDLVGEHSRSVEDRFNKHTNAIMGLNKGMAALRDLLENQGREIDDVVAAIMQRVEADKKKAGLPEGVNEALNSGDGAYRP